MRSMSKATSKRDMIDRIGVIGLAVLIAAPCNSSVSYVGASPVTLIVGANPGQAGVQASRDVLASFDV